MRKKFVPVLSSVQGGHRQAAWTELFYDLAYVVTVAQLAHQLIAHPSLAGLIDFSAKYVLVWWAWLQATLYMTRFGTSEDISRRFLGTAEMILLVFLAISVGLGTYTDNRLFFGCYIAIRSLQLINLYRAGCHVEVAREYCNGYTVGFALAIIVWAVSLLFPKPWNAYGYVLAAVIELLTVFTYRGAVSKVPPHYSHLPERFALFTILVMAELFVSAVAGTIDQGATVDLYFHVALAVLIAVALWWLYFDRIDCPPLDEVHKPDVLIRYLSWAFLHLPSTFGIAITGTGVYFHIIPDHVFHVGDFTRILLPLGVVIFLLADSGIYRTADRVGPTINSYKGGFIIRILGAAAIAIVAWLSPEGHWTLGLIAAVLWVLVLIDLWKEMVIVQARE